MQVIVSPEVTTDPLISALQQKAQSALAQNSMFLGVDDEQMEMVAVITTIAGSDKVLIDFAMHSNDDGHLRLTVGGNDAGEPVPIETILGSDKKYIDPTMFCGIVVRACNAMAELRKQDSQKVH